MASVSSASLRTSRLPRIPGVAWALRLAVTYALAGGLASAQPAPPPADPHPGLLPKARAYVEAYTERFANLMSEERAEQELRTTPPLRSTPRAMAGSGPAPVVAQPPDTVQRRRLTANYIVVRAETGLGWLPFRDVYEVDGRPVADRPKRLTALLSGKGPVDIATARKLVAEGTRHDLGNLERSLNVPVFGLIFLHPQLTFQSTFAYAGEDAVGDRPAAVYRFQEVGKPALVTGPGGSNLVSAGRAWIDPASGVVLKTEHKVTANDVDATITVTFADDARLGLAVPDHMDEEYRWTSRRDILRVTARYSNYRKLDVSTTEETPLPGQKKPPGR
jgi:hypothetical protein